MLKSACMRMAALVLPAMMLAGGCAKNEPAKEGTKAVESINTVAVDLGKGQAEVDKVLAGIDQLQAGGDLKTAFANYSAGVTDVEEAGKKVRARAEAMQANREAYIAKWQTDLETIQNPEVRAALEERKKKVAQNFDDIRTKAGKVREAYVPFLKNIQEIQKGLALDLNPAGVAAMKGPLDKARTEGATLKSSLSTLQAELTEIHGSLAAPVPAQK